VLNGAFTYLTNFAPAGERSWRMTASRNGVAPQGPASPITSYAYCAKLPPASLKKGTDSLNTGPGHVYPSALSRRCARGVFPTGGGFRAPYVSIGSDREATLVTEQQQVGRRWRVFGIGLGTTGQTLNLTAIALCR
jgi:hypothetical protein